MTGICGAVGNSESRVASALDAMMRAMWRRGTRTRSYITRAGKKVVGIGICDNPVFPSPGFLLKGNSTIAIDGFFYDMGHGRSKLRETGPHDLARLLAMPGAFCFLAASEEGLVVGRDPIGQKPLYSGTGSDGLKAFASLRAGLDPIGVENRQPIPAGTVVSPAKGFADSSQQLMEPSENAVPEDDALQVIHELLSEAILTGVPKNPGIAFSGGLDSALVATLAQECGKDPELVTVGIEGQQELDHAHQVAVELGLPITIREITPGEVLDCLGDVVTAVESPNPTIVGVSIPFYFVCRKVREMGRNIVMAGQMSDELFGGYARFEELITKGKPDQARIEMWKSVLAASTNDFEPADKVAVSLGLETRCPFAYLPLVEYALRLPLSLKVSVSSETVTRKYIVRKLAARLKLPDSVVKRPKKAVQYSSGVQKVLLKEARRRNLSLDRFLAQFAT